MIKSIRCNQRVRNNGGKRFIVWWRGKQKVFQGAAVDGG